MLRTSQKRKFYTLAQLKIEILCSGGLKIESTISGPVKNSNSVLQISKNRNSVLRPVKNSRSVLRQSLTHRRAAVVRDSIVLGSGIRCWTAGVPAPPSN